MWARRLTPEQQGEMLKAYDRGDRVIDIASRFGVHHSYPALLARRRKKPTRLNKENKRYARETTEPKTKQQSDVAI